MRPTWSSAIPSQPRQLASSALVQRLASRAQRRRTFPAAAHSSSVFRTRFSRSGGSVRVWPSIATTRGEARTPVVPCPPPTRRRSRRPALPSQLAHGGPVGVEVGIDLVGPIHRDIDVRLEADQRDAELPRELGRRL